MYTTKTGAAAIGAVAVLVALSACAGVRGTDPEPASLSQSQQFQDSARRESAAMRAELHARDAATSVQSVATLEGIRTAKQSEARSDAESRRQHDLEHGASSERLR